MNNLTKVCGIAALTAITGSAFFNVNYTPNIQAPKEQTIETQVKETNSVEEERGFFATCSNNKLVFCGLKYFHPTRGNHYQFDAAIVVDMRNVILEENTSLDRLLPDMLRDGCIERETIYAFVRGDVYEKFQSGQNVLGTFGQDVENCNLWVVAPDKINLADFSPLIDEYSPNPVHTFYTLSEDRIMRPVFE